MHKNKQDSHKDNISSAYRAGLFLQSYQKAT